MIFCTLRKDFSGNTKVPGTGSLRVQCVHLCRVYTPQTAGKWLFECRHTLVRRASTLPLLHDISNRVAFLEPLPSLYGARGQVLCAAAVVMCLSFSVVALPTTSYKGKSLLDRHPGVICSHREKKECVFDFDEIDIFRL